MRAFSPVLTLLSLLGLACSSDATPAPSPSTQPSGGAGGLPNGNVAGTTAAPTPSQGGLGGSGGLGTAGSQAGLPNSNGGATLQGGAGTGGGPSTVPSDLELAAAGLDGFRWEIECGALVGDWSCTNYPVGMDSCPEGGTQFANTTLTFGGKPGNTYAVELRFRGLAEPNVYSGGAAEADGFHVGGGGGGHRNIIALHVSAPEGVYYLNSVPSTDGPHYALQIDYVKTLLIEAGATVTMSGHDGDCISDKNCTKDVSPCEPISVPDLPPYPAAWDGNFVQMDVVSVQLRL